MYCRRLLGAARSLITVNQLGLALGAALLHPLATCHWVAAQPVIFVKSDATGTNDGTSWVNAYTTLEPGLSAAADMPAGTQVWVAAGTYKPTAPIVPSDPRSASFTPPSERELYGGFNGTETELVQRDPDSNVTILSGDIGVVGESADNSYHVIRAIGAPPSTVVDGFTISGGTANGTGDNSRGGGVYLVGPTTTLGPTFGQCRIVSNEAQVQGGGMYAFASSPTVTACVFSQNLAVLNGQGGQGGALFVFDGAPSLVGCTFRDNLADQGAGVAVGFNLLDRTGPTLSQCTFIDNLAINVGGGVYCIGLNMSGRLVLDQCHLTNNEALVGGGGLYAFTTQLVLWNSALIANQAPLGGGLHITGHASGAPSSFLNCTFAGNVAGVGGGILAASGTQGAVTNCIIWGDSAAGRGEPICSEPDDLEVSFSAVDGGYAGTGNIDLDPHFIDSDGLDNVVGTHDDNVRLASPSPCIDAGDSGQAQAAGSFDLDGRPRFVDDPLTRDSGVGAPAVVDMGAYELGRRTVYVKKDAAGDNDGTSWANAYPELGAAITQDAIYGGAEIWVAAGTYTPAGPGADRTETLQLLNGTPVYGGFLGFETLLRERNPDPDMNQTIVSGDLNGDDEPALPDEETPLSWNENSYHVVSGGGTDASALLDGFTITAGNANACCPHNRGGGAYIVAGSPALRNCRFTHNAASVAGGGMSCEPSSRPLVSFCTFEANRAACPAGGGPVCPTIDLQGDACQFGASQIPCKHISQCTSTGGGGAACRHDSSATFVNCRFVDNYTDKCGGAVVADFCSAVRLVNCLIGDNTAAIAGGGYCSFKVSAPPAAFINCVIRDNLAEGAGASTAHGGGVYVVNSDLDLVNSIVWGNVALGPGSQIALFPQALPLPVEPSHVNASYCDIQNLSTPASIFECAADCVFTPIASFSADPGWDASSRLMASSPCIDAGDSSAVPSDASDADQDGFVDEPTPLDLHAELRFVGDPHSDNTGVALGDAPVVDIGAYEFLPPDDCNGSGVPDYVELYVGVLTDCNHNDSPDACEGRDDNDFEDCDMDGVFNACEIDDCPAGDPGCSDCYPHAGPNGVPDACDIDSCPVDMPECHDCNMNGVPDQCDIAAGAPDCQVNGVPDSCEIPLAASLVDSKWAAQAGPWSCGPGGKNPACGPVPVWCPDFVPNNLVGTTFDVGISGPMSVVTLDISPTISGLRLDNAAAVEVSDASGADVRTLAVGEAVINRGIFRATERERFVLDAATIDQSTCAPCDPAVCTCGVLEASEGTLDPDNDAPLAYSILQINGAQVIGGVARTIGKNSAIHLIGGAELIDVQVQGVVVPDGQVGLFGGNIVNSGMLQVAPQNEATTFFSPSLTGGTLMGDDIDNIEDDCVRLGGETKARLGDFRSTFTNSANHRIDGQGIIFGGMDNQGSVVANVSGKKLTILPPGDKTNNGVLRAEGGGTLRIADAIVQSAGAGIEAGNGSTVLIEDDVFEDDLLGGGGLLVLGGVVNIQPGVDTVFQDCIDFPSFLPDEVGPAGAINVTAATLEGNASNASNPDRMQIESGLLKLDQGAVVDLAMPIEVCPQPGVTGTIGIEIVDAASTLKTDGSLDLCGGLLHVAGTLTAGKSLAFENTDPADWNWGPAAKLVMNGGVGAVSFAQFVHLEVGGQDFGPPPGQGFADNFDLTELVIGPGAHVCLVDFSDNTAGPVDVLYVDQITFADAFGVLNLNGMAVYLPSGPVQVGGGIIDQPCGAAGGDADSDGDADLADFAALENCFTESGAAVNSGCAPANFDGQGAVDLADFAVMMMTGPAL